MKKWIYVVLVLSIAGIGGFSVHASSSAHKKHLNVSQMNVDDEFNDTVGTFIFHDVQKDKTFVYNRERANKRQTPQSTFKVVNALIGLQVKAVRDEYDVKRWDGVKREFESWNRDHTLGSAMRESAIWYYQALARDIGEERMKTWLHTLSYGNEDISGGIDQFWLQSSLTISPLEQEAFFGETCKRGASI